MGDDLPEDFIKRKILPELLKSVEFGGGGPKCLDAVLNIGTKLSDEEYDNKPVKKSSSKRKRRKKNDEPIVYDIPPVERKYTNFKG